MTTELLLPDATDAGDVRNWYLPVNEVAGGTATSDPEFYVTYARFLGLGTSHTPNHTDHRTRRHDPSEWVRRGERCNACRWFEARIFRELELPAGVTSLDQLDDPAQARLGSYIVHNAGMSIVPNEVALYRYEMTKSPYMVVELMTTRRVTEDGPQVFLAKPSAHALASAAEFDAALREAYLDRAVK